MVDLEPARVLITSRFPFGAGLQTPPGFDAYFEMMGHALQPRP